MPDDRRINESIERGEPFSFAVDGVAVRAHPGETIGAALAAAGVMSLRHTPVEGRPRGLYCGMGLCHDCHVTVDGVPNIRACQADAAPDQRVERQRGLGVHRPEDGPLAPGTLTPKRVPLVVVGAGPAGLAAACSAARAGVDVIVLDESGAPGGQIYRQLPATFDVREAGVLGVDHADGRALLDEVAALGPRIAIWCEAVVWSVFGDRQLAVARGRDLILLEADAIVVAAGAYDRPVPVPGWTLPGVLTAGGAQVLLKSQRVLPGRRVLLAGTGPLQLVLANQLLDAGAEVVAVGEASGRFAHLRHVPALLAEPALLRRGLAYRRRLRRAGVPFLSGHVIESIDGDGRVERARLTQVDAQWRRRPGPTRTFSVDTVCLGYGFVPRAELCGLLGCRLRHDAEVGGWVPAFDDDMATDRPGVFVAGDGAGVAGALVARAEGALAGIGAAARLGGISPRQARASAAPFRRRLRDLRRFRRALDAISRVRGGLYADIADDTIVCRCEEVTAGAIREAAREGTVDLTDVKKRTRAGMGHCQGTMCTPTMQWMLGGVHGLDPGAVGGMTPRPPVRPIPLAVLLAGEGGEVIGDQ